MPVFNGQAVDEAVTNPAFLDAQVDDTAFGIITLANGAPASGPTIVNIQGLMNHLETTTGATETTDGTSYSSQTRITNGDDHETALGDLDSAFNGVTGHTHDGTDGHGPALTASSITGNPLHGYFVQAVDLTAVTGSNYDVSAYLSGYPVSAGPTSEGIVVTSTFNRTVLQQATGTNEGDPYVDGSGNVVYGRVTNSGGPSGTWTLDFFSLIGGTETAYSFASPSDIRWYFQQLFNPLSDAPVYSEIAIIPSDNATADVIPATTSLQGKVMLASAAAADVGTAGSAGTANATVANADHVHRGVSSFKKTAGTTRYGGLAFTPGTGINITDNADGSYTWDATGTSGVSDIAANGGSPETGSISLNDGNGVAVRDTGSGNFEFDNKNQCNSLLNGAFDLWQRYGASPSDTVANTVTKYIADRWAIKNSLGPSGVITGSQVAGGVDGSKYGLSVQITTAPTSSPNNGTETYQTLENFDSLKYYNKSASWGLWLKALGNVTQVGLQFVYNTTEALATTTIGSEVLVAVTTGAFSLGSVLNQAIGTAQTLAGVVGVRIRITAVSSGNTYDVTNGYILEQAMWNPGSQLGTFKRQFDTFLEELEGAQRFFEKSYDIGVAPGSATMVGQWELYQPNTTGTLYQSTPYHVSKRVSVSPTIYSPNSGSVNNIYNLSAPADVSVSSVTVFGAYGFSQIVLGGSVGTNQVAQWQWINDAEIY